MMRKIQALFIILSLCSILYGQKEFAPIGATWYYSKNENFRGDEGYVKIVSERDTIISGKPCKVLSQKYYSGQEYYIEEYGGVVVRDDIYVHQNGDTVFAWLDNEFRVLYNFSLNVGDTMQIYSEEMNCIFADDKFGEIVVTDVSVISINGYDLKKISTLPAEGSYYTYYGPFIEIIGGTYGVFAYDHNCLVDVLSDIGRLRCYSDDNIGDYKASGSIICDALIVGIDKNENKKEIVFDYNPVEKTAVINIPSFYSPNELNFMVTDITGRKVHEHILNNSSLKINLSDISEGLYIVSIFNKQKILFHEKIYIK